MVSRELIIEKMIAELEQARSVHAKKNALQVHISKVQVMCELLLDGEVAKAPVATSKQTERVMGITPAQVEAAATPASNDPSMGSIFDF